MWKKRLVGLLLSLFLCSWALSADVVLTDEQAQELEQTLGELETILQEQQMTINEQESLIEQQQTRMNELKTSLEEQETSSVKQSILLGLTSLCIGLLLGLLI